MLQPGSCADEAPHGVDKGPSIYLHVRRAVHIHRVRTMTTADLIFDPSPCRRVGRCQSITVFTRALPDRSAIDIYADHNTLFDSRIESWYHCRQKRATLSGMQGLARGGRAAGNLLLSKPHPTMTLHSVKYAKVRPEFWALLPRATGIRCIHACLCIYVEWQAMGVNPNAIEVVHAVFQRDRVGTCRPELLERTCVDETSWTCTV